MTLLFLFVYYYYYLFIYYLRECVVRGSGLRISEIPFINNHNSSTFIQCKPLHTKNKFKRLN